MGKLILGYWNIHGLGSPIRFLLELLNVDYEEKIYDCNDKDKWLNEKKNLGLLYPNLPYIIDQTDDGQTIKMTEHLPIMRYLAKKHGLYPQTEAELLVAEQTESFVWDVRIRESFAAYAKDFEMAKSEFLVVARQKLPYLNDLLAKNEYVTGKLSYVDVVLYDFCLVLSVFAPELLEEHPNIKRHFKAIDSLPAIKNYRNGKGKGVWKERTFHLPNAAFQGKI